MILSVTPLSDLTYLGAIQINIAIDKWIFKNKGMIVMLLNDDAHKAKVVMMTLVMLRVNDDVRNTCAI